MAASRTFHPLEFFSAYGRDIFDVPKTTIVNGAAQTFTFANYVRDVTGQDRMMCMNNM